MVRSKVAKLGIVSSVSMVVVFGWPANKHPVATTALQNQLSWFTESRILRTQTPPNYPLRDPKYHLIETIRPLIELHWVV